MGVSRRSPGDPMMRFGAVLIFFLMSATAGAQEFATVTTNAPIYATAQETPTPLRGLRSVEPTMKAGWIAPSMISIGPDCVA